MKNLTKVVAVATVMAATSASAFFGNNGYNHGYTNGNGMSNWGPFDGGSNMCPVSGGNNWGPFTGGQNMGPFSSGSNMGPFNGAQNFGPFANNNDMNNDSDWGFHYNNKNSTKNVSNATTDGQYAGSASANAKAQADAYSKGQADGFAKGQADAYAKGYADGKAATSVDSRN